jgi:hypothetical protein
MPRPMFPAPMMVTFMLNLLAVLTSLRVIVPEPLRAYSVT